MNEPDVLLEIAKEICQHRDLKCEHPRITIRGVPGNTQLDIIDIWHQMRVEYIRLRLYEDGVEVEVWDRDDHCAWNEIYSILSLDPDKIREDCFGAMAEILQQELGIAEKVVNQTKAFLKEIKIDE